MRIYVAIVALQVCWCLPVEEVSGPPPKSALDFMKQYGYLKADKETSAALYTEEGLSEAIKTVQRFGAINETGRLDEATLKLMAKPRCGNADVIPGKRTKRFTFGSSGWNKRHITYYLANWSSKLGEEKVARLINKALNAWGAYGSLKFSRQSTPDADIIVSFARGAHNDPFPFDGPGYVLAHAFFPNAGSAISGDIHFDDDEQWVESTPQEVLESGTDFYSVALHELGHSLGLGHSNDERAVMFPYYRGDDDSYLQLGQDDILAMYQLYIARPIQETTESTTTESTTRRTRPYNTRPPQEPSTPIHTVTTHTQTSTTTEPTIYTRAPTYRTTETDRVRTSSPSINTRAPIHRTTETDRVRTSSPTIYTRAPTHGTTDTYRVRTSSPSANYPYGWSGSTDIPTRDSTITTRTPSTFYPTPNSRNTEVTSGYTRTTWYNNPPFWKDRAKTTTMKSNNGFSYSTTTEFSTSRDRNRPDTSATINRKPSYSPSRYPIRTQSTIPPPEPNICQGKVDSVANLRGEIFIFKDQYIWRLQDRRRIVPGYPVLLRQMFPHFPENIKKIDAAYQRPDGNMILFTGDLYWVYDGSNFIDSPRFITDYGVPLEIGGIDAVQTWARNGKTYLYKGDRFWRYDETSKTVEPGYPALIEEKWRGIPRNVDAAMTWKDGLTYFFKDDQYWTFDNNRIKATYDSPRPSTREWLGCP